MGLQRPLETRAFARVGPSLWDILPSAISGVWGVQGIKAFSNDLFFVCHLPNEPILVLNSEIAVFFIFLKFTEYTICYLFAFVSFY